MRVPLSFLRAFAVGWLLLSLPAYGLIERRLERSFPVGDKAALKVDSFYGRVTVREVPDAKQISVVVLQSADVDTEAGMEHCLKALDLRMEQARSGTVSVSARFKNSFTWSWKAWPPVVLVYEIQVPRRCDVQITTGEGSISTGALQGRVVLRSESGAIFSGEVEGSVKARNRSGAVAITACTGPLDVSTDTGNITVGRASGRATLASSGGLIELQRAAGEVVVCGDGSDAQVGFVSPITHAANISTSGGSVSLVVENSAACTLDVRASMFGKVALRGDLPLTVNSGAVGQSELKAEVNGGGVRIRARAAGGNVLVRGVVPLPADNGAKAVQASAGSVGGV